MADSTWLSVNDQVDLRRPTLEAFPSATNPSNRPSTNRNHGDSLDNVHERTLSTTLSMSRRTLRQSSMVGTERKAYPLPSPSQFDVPNNAAPLPSDPAIDILYPMQSFKRFTEQERQKVSSPSDRQPPAMVMEALKRPAPNMGDTDKQPYHPPPVPEAEVKKATEIEQLETVKEEDAVKDVQSTSSSKVVVVYDAEKKFSTTAVDIALKEHATGEGDAIVVVAFLEYIMSPMGHKMVADLKQFSGVNENILIQTAVLKKRDIETKLRDTSRLQECQTKKIQLDVKVLPGANPKVVVAKEIMDSQATCVIFDKNAMRNKKYYKETLSCRILRVRSDGRSVETVSLFGQSIEKTGSITSHGSDSSSESSMNSELSSNSPSMWSKLKRFGSKRSTGSFRHSHGGHGSSILGSSSRTSSNLGSPRPRVEEEDGPVPEVLEESFSFDSPKPNSATEAFVYAAAGLGKFSTYPRRNTESLPAALAA